MPVLATSAETLPEEDQQAKVDLKDVKDGSSLSLSSSPIRSKCRLNRFG